MEHSNVFKVKIWYLRADEHGLFVRKTIEGLYEAPLNNDLALEFAQWSGLYYSLVVLAKLNKVRGSSNPTGLVLY